MSDLLQGENRDKWIASDHSALVPKLDKLKDEVRALPVLIMCHRCRA